MAERMDVIPSEGDGRGNPKYPWTEWLDGGIWALDPDVDYPGVTQEGMRSQVHHAAGTHAKRAITRLRGERLYIQAFPR